MGRFTKKGDKVPPEVVERQKRERKKNDLPLGMVGAIAAANLGVPPDATPEAKALAAHMTSQIVRVADGKIGYRQAPTVLKAAIYGREIVTGPLTQKVQVSGKLTLEDLLSRVEDHGKGE